MADATYCRASPLVWDDEVFVDLSDLGRTIWFALLLGPQVTVLPGLQRGSVATIADTLRRPTDAVAAELALLDELGRVHLVDSKRVIWLPRGPKHHPAESPNHIKAWWRRWNEIPDCGPKWAHVARLKEHAGLANEKHANAWACTFENVEGEAADRAAEALPQALPKGSACAYARPRAADAAAEAAAGAGADAAAGAEPPAADRSAEVSRPPKPDADELGMSAAALRVRDVIVADADLAAIVKRPNALAADLVAVGPGIDLARAVAAAGAWLRANPTRRKHNGNQFLLGWVRREQDGAGRAPTLPFASVRRAHEVQRGGGFDVRSVPLDPPPIAASAGGAPREF